MTAGDLFGLFRRRWYLLLLGVTITAAILWPAVNRPGVYWTQVNVVVLSPTYEYFPNKLQDPQYSLSALAGLVVADFNGTNRPLPTASSDTTFFGTGQTTGAEVRLPNLGSQWRMFYPNPTIDVQVVDDSAQKVETKANEIVRRLNDLLQARQDALGIAPEWRATTISSPDPPSIYYAKGSRVRALGAGAVAGLCLTIAGVYWIDRFLSSRRPKIGASIPGRTKDRLLEPLH